MENGFWSNHFCVSADKGGVRPLCGAYEREAIRPYVLGRFGDMLKGHVERAPLGRNVEPEEVGKTALYLASDLSTGVTGEVLMVGWMDDEALHRTLTTGRCTYWSRSRQEYWVKGDTSGSQQWVKSVALDCDGDTLLVKVDQVGSGACHTGDRTCFDAGDLGAQVGTP